MKEINKETVRTSTEYIFIKSNKMGTLLRKTACNDIVCDSTELQ